MVSSRISKRPCLKNKIGSGRGRKISDRIFGLQRCPHMYTTHICVHTHVYIQKKSIKFYGNSEHRQKMWEHNLSCLQKERQLWCSSEDVHCPHRFPAPFKSEEVEETEMSLIRFVESVDQHRSTEQDQSNLRENIHLSYLYKCVYFPDNYLSHCLLLLLYINYLFNGN